jgi:hypothetical protein
MGLPHETRTAIVSRRFQQANTKCSILFRWATWGVPLQFKQMKQISWKISAWETFGHNWQHCLSITGVSVARKPDRLSLSRNCTGSEPLALLRCPKDKETLAGRPADTVDVLCRCVGPPWSELSSAAELLDCRQVQKL